MTGEFDFIEWIKSQLTPSDLVKVPVGDDLAVLNWPKDELLLVGADQVIDGVHFDSAIHTPRQIGRKAMNRNLSDCAAMACLPAAAVVTVALPKGVSIDYTKELYLGLKEAADVFNCPIVGGDTSTWNGKLVLSVTIMGRAGGIKPVTRRGARVGDYLMVTGALGGSILGRHLSFSPRVNEARKLADVFDISSMLDISDGLSRDVQHLCKPTGLGAVLYAERIPIHTDAFELFRKYNVSPLEHALHDGEDYELLFTVDQPDIVDQESGAGEVRLDGDWAELLPLPVPVGRMTEEPGVWLEHPDGRREPLTPKGWEHSLE